MPDWLTRGFTEFKYSRFTDLKTRETFLLPTIEIKIRNDHSGDSVLTRSLVDSGAQDVLIDEAWAKVLGINLDSCPEEEVKGLGGGKMGRIHSVEIVITKNGESVFIPKAYFVKDMGISAIFGQLDFFSKYEVHFNYREQSFWIKKLPSTDDL